MHLDIGRCSSLISGTRRNIFAVFQKLRDHQDLLLEVPQGNGKDVMSFQVHAWQLAEGPGGPPSPPRHGEGALLQTRLQASCLMSFFRDAIKRQHRVFDLAS